MTPAEQQETLERATEAKRLLDNPLLKAAFKEIEDGLLAAAINFAPKNDEDRIQRDRLIEAIKITRKLSDMLRSHVETGEIIKKDIREIQSGKKPFF